MRDLKRNFKVFQIYNKCKHNIKNMCNVANTMFRNKFIVMSA